MSGSAPITARGLDRIKKELDHLIKVEREELKVIISEARELGDLKENAEYHAAKEKQSHIEGRISQLQAVVAKSRIVDVASIDSDKIVFGATINLIDSESGQRLRYQLVGEDESDFREGRVSYTSPLGMALIGKEVGDNVIVKAPKGDVEYEVESFEYT
jgi:transcription elongation factor GreA